MRTVLAPQRLRTEIAEVDCREPIRLADSGDALPAPAARVTVLLRPDDVVHDDASPVKALVRAKAFRGAEILYTLQPATAARWCWRSCPRITTMRSTSRSASASSSTT